MDFFEDDDELAPLPTFQEPDAVIMNDEMNSPEPDSNPTDSLPKLDLTLDLSDDDKSTNANKQEPLKIRKTRIVAKLDAEKLLSADGLPKLLSDSRKLKFRGKGHEQTDLEKLLSFFQLWGHNLFPKLKFKSFVDRTEKICKEKRTRIFHSAVLSETNRNNIYESGTSTFEEIGAQNLNESLDLDKELEDAIKAKEIQDMIRHDEFMSNNNDDDDDLLAQIIATRDRALSLGKT